jgi:two-component system, OmpR family, response regulator AdeR
MSKKILIVEDNQSTGALLASQLQKAGFEVLLAPDAMVATKEANRWKPDLVILDLMLPAGGGTSVLKNMKKSVYTATTPVIAVTASLDPRLRDEMKLMGVHICLQKPYPHEELIRLIQQSLGLPSTQT